jgi:hypothetical protein
VSAEQDVLRRELAAVRLEAAAENRTFEAEERAWKTRAYEHLLTQDRLVRRGCELRQEIDGLGTPSAQEGRLLRAINEGRLRITRVHGQTSWYRWTIGGVTVERAGAADRIREVGWAFFAWGDHSAYPETQIATLTASGKAALARFTAAGVPVPGPASPADPGPV